MGQEDDKQETETVTLDVLQRYKIVVDIYKGYMDTALTANVWGYALTGAIVAHFMTHRAQGQYLKLSLLLPLFVSVASAIIALRGIDQADDLEKPLKSLLRDELKLKGNPPSKILKGFLTATIFLNVLVLGGLVYILCQF